MKKISIILAALALAITMSQCKKNEGQPTYNDKVVTITLDVKNNNSSKVVVNTATGTVDFETGDKIYVGSGGKYVGFLIHNGTNFIGNITNPTEDQPLQFYFLGNVTPQETLSAGTTEECSVIISDQTEHLPVISCATSNENYVSGVTAYSAHLLNKCALVKFNVTTPSNSPICITGMKNKVTVDFTQNTMTPCMDGEGVIKLPAGSGENVEKWAILLPQVALEEGEEGSAYSEDGTYTGIRPIVPAIVENGYLSEGITMIVSVGGVPIGAINGLFSVSDTKQVYFSRGNLQYIGGAPTPYWKFADNQWICLGNNGQGSGDPYANRDLFGFGTSGYNHGANCYQPWSISENYSDYIPYGEYSDPRLSRIYNLYDQTGQADWGYNPIINGGNTPNQWRTLTSYEWQYVFYTRTNICGFSYAKANVNSINGVILVPDNWSSSYYVLNNTNDDNASFNSNILNTSQWDILEQFGAVFLPAAGYRDGTTIGYVGEGGVYRSSTGLPGPVTRTIVFTGSVINMNYTSNCLYRGFSVRLVQDNQR
jgi:hypothetical protein